MNNMNTIAKIFFLLFFSLQILFSQTVTHSVVVGGVTETSARLWIRTSSQADVKIELADNPLFVNSFFSGTKAVEPDKEFSTIIDVAGLQPEQVYFYRIWINNLLADFEQRKFHTFPAPGTEAAFSFAFGSCIYSGDPPVASVFNEMIKHDPKFFINLGDWTYPDTTDATPFNNNYFSNDYNLVKQSYLNKFRNDYEMDTIFKTTPISYIYDDHDFSNNNSSATTVSFSVPIKPTIFGDDFVAIEIPYQGSERENSIRGYKDFMPSYPLVNESRGIYHKFSYGNVDVFMLDLRAQRSPNQASLKKDSINNIWVYEPADSQTILGRDHSPGEGTTQIDWLLSELLSSTADWKFLVSSVPFNIAQQELIEFGMEIQDSILQLPPPYPEGVRGIFAAMEFSDKWAGFPKDIDTLMNFISVNQIKNVIILSGDSHTAAIDDGANSGLPEIMAGGLSQTNSKLLEILQSFGINIWNSGGQGLTTQNFFNAFGKVSVFGSDSVRLDLIDETGDNFASLTITESVVSADQIKNLKKDFYLAQNFPNPFNPVTTIVYKLPAESKVKLEIFNLLGEKILTIADDIKPAGYHKEEFSTSAQSLNLSSGVYFYRLTVESLNENEKFSETKKLLFLK